MRWRVAYVVASIATFLNMYVVLVALYPDNPGVSDWLGIGGAIRSSFGVTTVALLHSAAFVWGVLQLRPGARRALAAQLERGRVEEESLRPGAGDARCAHDRAGSHRRRLPAPRSWCPLPMPPATTPQPAASPRPRHPPPRGPPGARLV